MTVPHCTTQFRDDFRRMLEQSGQSLLIYGWLLKRYQAKAAGSLHPLLLQPRLQALRDKHRHSLLPLKGIVLGMRERLELIRLMADVLPEDDDYLELLLLEHFAYQLERYLAAAKHDSDRRRYLEPLLRATSLLHRPVDLLIEARRQAAATSHPEIPLLPARARG